MNKALKAKIFLQFGRQGEFADTMGCSEAVVSRVINNRMQLSEHQQKLWAAALGTTTEKIFPANGQ